MLWFVMIGALIVTALVALLTRNLRRAALAGLITLIAGVIIALGIVYSGVLGG